MKHIRRGIILFFCLFLSSCAAKVASLDDFKIEQRHAVITLPPYAQDIMQAVDKRNDSVEKDPKWVEKSYEGLHIRKLNDIPYSEYDSYAKYVDNGSVYVIVHPAYYMFFHSKKPLIERNPEDMGLSIGDIFLQETYDKPIIRYMQEQSRNEKNFIEYVSMKGNLVILVLPRNYLQHPSYSYGIESSERDEFARYLNEITNGSDSVLYMESNSPTGGKLLVSDQVMLFSFLSRVRADKILVGGGYVGRCQGEFYNYVTSYATTGNYVIVPEISVFSPEDISDKRAELLLNAERDNSQLASAFISRRMSGRPNMQHIATWQFDSFNTKAGSVPHKQRLPSSAQRTSLLGIFPSETQENAIFKDNSDEPSDGYY